ncbi:hypothetical protein L4C54_12590 [Vibrio lamellibrachiae]|uniref:hypothetical protein n=1 Tax=Vibrio lamellibrachiae TaxID=2910253 RepID=UPI003D15243C
MSVSSIQSGYQIIEQSSRMAEEAAHEIQVQPQPPMAPVEIKNDFEFNKVKFEPPEETSFSYTDPLIKLNQAHQYNNIGTNMLQRDQDMIGTLLDIHI